MEINRLTLVIVGVGAVVLIIFLIKKNRKDKKELEKEANYFEKPDESELNDHDAGL